MVTELTNQGAGGAVSGRVGPGCQQLSCKHYQWWMTRAVTRCRCEMRGAAGALSWSPVVSPDHFNNDPALKSPSRFNCVENSASAPLWPLDWCHISESEETRGLLLKYVQASINRVFIWQHSLLFYMFLIQVLFLLKVTLYLVSSCKPWSFNL